ncbi:MAG: PEP-CTERM sorting domain-containing protein [Rhizonema sp. PD38]|nr:PEP-CTERM sorting domain-containing protein [Rhizonema sp. PD38]
MRVRYSTIIFKIPCDTNIIGICNKNQLLLLALYVKFKLVSLGGQIYSSGGDAQVTILPPNPGVAYTSQLRLFSSLDPNGPFTAIGTNQEVGKIVDLGSFSSGQELLFGIHVQNTGQTYFAGPASRNPDNTIHDVTTDISPGVINASFEDLPNAGDKSYNNLNFQYRGNVASKPVPEPVTILGTLTAISLGTAMKKKFRQVKVEN